MTNTELLRRLAGIEGMVVDEITRKIYWNGNAYRMCPQPMPIEECIQDFFHKLDWNPLKDWNVLGPLIVKYKVDVEFNHLDSKYRATTWGSRGMAGTYTSYNLPTAVVTAIVEAHK